MSIGSKLVAMSQIKFFLYTNFIAEEIQKMTSKKQTVQVMFDHNNNKQLI